MSRKVTKDGRTILGGKDYTEFRRQVYYAQGAQCKSCSRYTFFLASMEDDYSFHVHHTNGRGMGGGKRDDTLEAVIGLCGACHRKEHGQ